MPASYGLYVWETLIECGRDLGIEAFGKPDLKWQAERSDYPRLIGLWATDPSTVPPEASQIVRGTIIVGRITSSRMSPSLRPSICVALVSQICRTLAHILTVRLPDGRQMHCASRPATHPFRSERDKAAWPKKPLLRAVR
jgi:glycine cleavage system aminomethyltransferase T